MVLTGVAVLIAAIYTIGLLSVAGVPQPVATLAFLIGSTLVLQITACVTKSRAVGAWSIIIASTTILLLLLP